MVKRKQFYTERELAALLGCSPITLRNKRYKGEGINYFINRKIGAVSAQGCGRLPAEERPQSIEHGRGDMTTADGGPRSPLPARNPMVAHQRPQCTHKSQGRESHRGYPRGYTRWVTTWSSIRRGPIGSRTEKRAFLSNRTPPSQWVREGKDCKGAWIR